VARAGNARAIWTWTLGYTVFLLALGGVLVALAATYGANTVPSAWIIVLTVIESILLLVAGTVLCGALLGRWRALVVSLLSFGLTFLGLYLVLAHTFATSGGSGDSTSWTGLLFYGMLPLSAFVVGWIYERRREANFGKSFLSMLAGTTFLILLPLTLVYILGSTGSPTGSTIAAYLLGIWCFLILLVFPLALVAASLEALLHKMVQSAVDGKKKDGG
jgi:hypothetical protein